MCCDLFSYFIGASTWSPTEDKGIYKYLRKFMALPFLPEDEIIPMFNRLERQASTAKLQSFVRYVSETWIMEVPFYLMINIPHNEARLASLHIRLATEKKMKRIQRKKYNCSMQAQVFTLWQEYENGERSAKQLLRGMLSSKWPNKLLRWLYREYSRTK